MIFVPSGDQSPLNDSSYQPLTFLPVPVRPWSSVRSTRCVPIGVGKHHVLDVSRRSRARPEDKPRSIRRPVGVASIEAPASYLVQARSVGPNHEQCALFAYYPTLTMVG